MAYQRLLNPKTIMVFVLAGLFAIAVSCGGAAEPTAESGALAPTAAATVPPATTAPASPAATPVAQAQPTNTPAASGMMAGEPEGTLNVGYKELGLFGTSPKLTPGQVMLFVGSTVGEQLLYRDADGNYLPKLVKEWSVSDDNLVWTMKLQEGVQFHPRLWRDDRR